MLIFLVYLLGSPPQELPPGVWRKIDVHIRWVIGDRWMAVCLNDGWWMAVGSIQPMNEGVAAAILASQLTDHALSFTQAVHPAQDVRLRDHRPLRRRRALPPAGPFKHLSHAIPWGSIFRPYGSLAARLTDRPIDPSHRTNPKYDTTTIRCPSPASSPS